MFRLRLVVLFMILFVVAAVPAIGAHGEGNKLAGTAVSAADIMGQMKAKDKAFLIDVRSFPEYKYGHIPGAINIPSPAIKILSNRLPKDKSAPIIIYARGDNYLPTNQAFDTISKMGYVNIKVFPGGMLEWHGRHFSEKKGVHP